MKRFCFLLLIIGLPGFLNGCSGSSDNIEKNIQNSQNLKLGMTLDEALEVMGKPDVVKVHSITRHNTTVTGYYYDAPFAAPEWIYFWVDSTNTVVEVNPYDIEQN